MVKSLDAIYMQYCSSFAFFIQMHLNATNVLEFSHQLATYTRDAVSFANEMDVIYVAYMMEKLITFMDEIRDVRTV